MRMALGIEYDGAQFHGWQTQKSLRSVQETLELAISKVADHEVQLHCAGSTDTGVHATGQVVHFETDVSRSMRSWIYGTNSNCPKDVSVRWAQVVGDDFHARYSALGRYYRYIIYNHPVRPSLYYSNLTWQYRPLDHKRMAEAAEYFIGEHDFSSFRAVGCQSKTPFRRVTAFNVSRRGDLIILDVKANAFLHHMVRNLVGVLVEIGSGVKPVQWAEDVLLSKDRRLGGVTAPAYGLYLVQVEYPAAYELPNAVVGPVFLTEWK